MKHFTIITDRFINCSFCSYLKLSITLLIRCACQDAKSVQPSIRPSYQTQCTKSVNVEKITTTSATILYNCLINLPLNRCIHAYQLWITTAVTTRTRCFTKHKPHESRQNPPTAATEEEWCRLLLRDVICNVRVSFHRCWWVMGVHSTFLSPVSLTFDLDRTGWARDQTHLPVNLAQICLAIPQIFDSQTTKQKTKKQTTRNVGQCPTWWPPCRI